MTRDEVILAIESTGHSDAQAIKTLGDQLRQRAIQDQARRTKWINDLERAVAYSAFMFSRGPNPWDKEVNEFLRPNMRSVLIGFVLIVILLFELVVLIGVAKKLPNEAYGLAGILFIFLFELSVFMWWAERFKRRNVVSDLGMHAYCIQCKYDLTGLGQVIGDQLAVGPARCPECGCSYPAVG